MHRGLRKKFKKVKHVLHAYKEEPTTRRRLFEKLSGKDCKVMAIYLNKQKVYTRLQSEKAVIYNYVTNILLDRVISKRLVPVNSPICLVASKRETNKFLNDNFSSYLQDQTENSHKLDLQIDIKTPAEERSLQAADFASWAIFRKLEYGDDYCYNIIENIIVEENVLFP